MGNHPCRFETHKDTPEEWQLGAKANLYTCKSNSLHTAVHPPQTKGLGCQVRDKTLSIDFIWLSKK